MAKKKLFGNVKEPRCETCAHGKLSADGSSVLCAQGGALPLEHSCRRYQYDPLRRVPKRRPEITEFSAEDFALDDATSPLTAVIPDETADKPEEHSTFEHLMTYLNEHETPDADIIRAILNKTYQPVTASKEELEAELEALTAQATADETSVEDGETAETDAAEETASKDDNTEAEPTEESIVEEAQAPDVPVTDELIDQIVEEVTHAHDMLSPDDSPAIDGDLERLDVTTPVRSLPPLTAEDFAATPLFLTDNGPSEPIGSITELSNGANAPLSADDLLFLPKGTPSDHDGADAVSGFTPLSISE